MQAPAQARDPNRYAGNVIAAQQARDFDTAKAAADFSRQTQEAYQAAQSEQEYKAIQAAERFARQQQLAGAVRGGMSVPDAVIQYGAGLPSSDLNAYSRLTPRSPGLQHVGDTLVDVSSGTPVEVFRSGVPQMERMELEDAYARRRQAQSGLGSVAGIADPARFQQAADQAEADIARLRGGGQRPAAASQYKNADEVKAAFRANRLGRDAARKILTEQFGYQ
jgi:hypothetical protein